MRFFVPARLFSFLGLLALFALALAPPAAVAQANPPQQACPVNITSATFTRHAPLPVPDPNATTADKSFGTLEFHYRNASGKPVRSFDVSARFSPRSGVQPPLLKTPENVEHYTQGAPLAVDDASNAHYEVQKNVRALLWLQLDKVEFQDGSSWTLPSPAVPGQCTYQPDAKLVPAHPVPASTPLN
jgi:hypothetical protein